MVKRYRFELFAAHWYEQIIMNPVNQIETITRVIGLQILNHKNEQSALPKKGQNNFTIMEFYETSS